MRRILLLICLCLTLPQIVGNVPGQVVLETPAWRYTVAADGRNLGFIDRSSGTDYLRRDAESRCAAIRLTGQEVAVTSAVLTGEELVLRFGTSGVEATLRVIPRPGWLELRVESVKGGAVESLVFLNVPLTLVGKPEEVFGACAFSLNLTTRVDKLPALQSELRASAERKFGLEGARVAVVGAPPGKMLKLLKEVLRTDPEMPLCPVAGPWAQEIRFNHGSYLFNFGSMTESNLDDWISMAHSLGFTQIDNHGGGSFFRFGDFELNREKWPAGWDTYRGMVERLHGAGIGSIFHTYAFFIDKHSKYVTPIPDARLDAFRTFTLAEEVDATADTLTVNESTAGMKTITGFFEHNSVLLHIGDELVTFGGVSQTAPWRFTGVARGALGTTAAAHPKAGRARHLKECFGLLVPDVETTLFTEIAANHAEIVNRCGFDGIYLDAIDGCSILRGADECWYWGDKFVMEIQKRLRKPVGMEMSSMWHHCWQYRTRWQAWDYPQRGQKRFVDLHARDVNGGLLLPLHLGWWNFQEFNPPQIEPSYPDVMEFLGARLVGWEAGISLTGAVDREKLRHTPLFRRAVDTLRKCEELRQGGTVDAATKAKLREPGSEFLLVTDAAGKSRFQRSHSEAHTVSLAEPWSTSWTLTNPFPAQKVRLRIEALMGAGEESSGKVLGLVQEGATAVWKSASATGVGFAVTASGETGAVLLATNLSQANRSAAWASLRKEFNPTLNLKDHQGLGLWVDGDGRGEILAIRLESPQHLSFGAIADRYLTIDFVGRRWITLVEAESARWSDYDWGDGKGAYNAYRETIDFGVVESISVWCQNLPPGTPVKCGLGPILALPLQKATPKDPTLVINGMATTFPGELESGSWLELFEGSDQGTVYDSKEEVVRKVSLSGPPPMLRAGTNQMQFSGKATGGSVPRLKVTVFSLGEVL